LGNAITTGDIAAVIYLALGSNLEDRKANLQAAIEACPPKVQPLAVSQIYRTPPWGYPDQAEFLNQVIKAETWLSPIDLLTYLKKMEVDLGREETFRYGPRRIDVDILFYGDMVLRSESLIIPHPRLHERAFVLVPLADLAPGLRHPVLGKTVRQMLSEVDQSGISIYNHGEGDREQAHR
jgi:2-amino-4-hydroxy-6-hydroxymethyldihydropteridine diphosphokinase